MQAPNTNNKTQQHPKQKQQQQQNGGKKQNQNKPAAAKPMRTITPVLKERTAYTHKQHLEQLDTIINKFNQPAPSIVLLGDSMFERWKTTGQYVWCEKNFARFGSILNAGVGGDGTQHVLWRLQPENTGLFTKIQPRFVLLMIGTNNIERDSPEHIAEAIKIILETIYMQSPETRVVLIGVLPRIDPPGINEKLARLNEILAKETSVAVPNVLKYVDFTRGFLAASQPPAPGSITSNKDLFDDHVHLNEKGYRVWADFLEPLLTSLPKEV